MRAAADSNVTQGPLITPSGVERFGLFTIIVLGEVIVGVVAGLAEHHLTWTVAATAALGLGLAVGLWWLYFDMVSLRLPRRRRGQGLAEPSWRPARRRL